MRTASRRPTRSGDGDDWFAEAPASATRGSAPDDTVEIADDWLNDEGRRPRSRRPRRDLPPVLRSRRAGLVAVGFVIVLVIGLIASGVFSSSPPSAPPTIPSTTAPPPTTAPVVPPLPVPSTVLKPGDTGAQVRTLQRALAALGDAPGKVDANYGPSTQAAVERFQKAHNLTADGIFGPATRKAMVAAVKKL